MTSFPIGALLMIAVLTFTLGGADLKVFINPHSIILVLGGTLATLALSTPSSEIFDLIRSLFTPKKGVGSAKNVVEDLTLLMKKKDAPLGSRHPLISYAQDLWTKGVDSQMMMALLGRKMEELNSSSERSVAAIRNLAKYPPALGMTGTVIGLVSLFSHLTPDNRTGLGPLLAMAMTATFYGLIMANAVLMPLADRLYVRHLAEMRSNEQIFKILLLIEQNEAAVVIEDELHAKAA